MNNFLTPAEQKEKQRQTKSTFVNLFLASIMICFSLISTLVEFETFTSQIVMAGFIIAATILSLILLVRWIKSLDEYEFNLNARACLVALYSSLLYLPLQYLSEIGLLPELHVTFLFLWIWFAYLIAIKYFSKQKS